MVGQNLRQSTYATTTVDSTAFAVTAADSPSRRADAGAAGAGADVPIELKNVQIPTRPIKVFRMPPFDYLKKKNDDLLTGLY